MYKMYNTAILSVENVKKRKFYSIKELVFCTRRDFSKSESNTAFYFKYLCIFWDTFNFFVELLLFVEVEIK